MTLGANAFIFNSSCFSCLLNAQLCFIIPYFTYTDVVINFPQTLRQGTLTIEKLLTFFSGQTHFLPVMAKDSVLNIDWN